MVVGDIEDVKRRLMLELLGDGFTAQIAAIDAEKADGNATPAPAAVFNGERRNLADVGFPVGEVIGVRTTYDQESASVDAQHEIAVIWTTVGSDELVVTRQLERLVRATREFLNRHVIAALNMAPMLVIAEEYSELDRRVDGSGFVKGASTLLHVTTYYVA